MVSGLFLQYDNSFSKKTVVLSFLVVVDFDGKCVVVAHFTTIHRQVNTSRIYTMALPVMEFSRQGYKIGKVFA